MVMLACPSEQPKTTDKLQKTFCISDGRLQKNYKNRGGLLIDYKKTTDKLQSNYRITSDPFPEPFVHRSPS